MAENKVPQQTGGMVDELIPDDPQTQYADLNDIEVIEHEKEGKQTLPDQEPAAPASNEDDELPEPLRGKSKAEIAKMYADAQSLIGRQGGELGELRKRTDQAIAASLEALRRSGGQGRQTADPAPKPKTKEEMEVEFYADPQKAIAQAIAEHPELQKLRGAAQQLAAQNIIRQKAESQVLFDNKYPDASEILGDPAFREWVGKSRYRQQMLARADKFYDVSAADEVLGTWKELKAARTPVQAAAAAAAQEIKATSRRKATVPTGGNASPTESSGKRIYRRAQILDMMQNEPDKYERMADEIAQAYAENRVR